jgi:hypothetical protein
MSRDMVRFARLKRLPMKHRIAHLNALLRYEASYPSPHERKRVVGREDANEMSVRVGGVRRRPPTLASASLRPSLPTASRGEGLNVDQAILIDSDNDWVLASGVQRDGRG